MTSTGERDFQRVVDLHQHVVVVVKRQFNLQQHRQWLHEFQLNIRTAEATSSGHQPTQDVVVVSKLQFNHQQQLSSSATSSSTTTKTRSASSSGCHLQHTSSRRPLLAFTYTIPANHRQARVTMRDRGASSSGTSTIAARQRRLRA